MSGTGWGIYGEILDGSGDPRGTHREVLDGSGDPRGRSGTDRGTIPKVRDS